MHRYEEKYKEGLNSIAKAAREYYNASVIHDRIVICREQKERLLWLPWRNELIKDGEKVLIVVDGRWGCPTSLCGGPSYYCRRHYS